MKSLVLNVYRVLLIIIASHDHDFSDSFIILFVHPYYD